MIVQDFMLKANRPYALNDIVDGCGGKELGKSATQKFVVKNYKTYIFSYQAILNPLQIFRLFGRQRDFGNENLWKK